jgi:hypothetical protein
LNTKKEEKERKKRGRKRGRKKKKMGRKRESKASYSGNSRIVPRPFRPYLLILTTIETQPK